ncbi:MAG TPA: DUF427 domain-containing protein [Bacteroidales bacterium]|nr:DUF427 domain-containing protein [Bacteroidales bacterium]
MAKAIWKDTIIAESDKTIEVEGNQYFPPESIRKEYFISTSKHTTCPWKGVASYYTIKIGDLENENGAWYYPEPKKAASEIKNYVAFWNGVRIES